VLTGVAVGCLLKGRRYRAIEIVRQSTVRQPVLAALPGKTLKMISATR
jgi:hypothetical protein